MERRSTSRGGSAEAGEALLNAQAGPMECVISHVSEKGARVTFAKPVLVPRSFELVFKSGHRTRVKVSWQRRNSAGVRFETPLPAQKKRTGYARLFGART